MLSNPHALEDADSATSSTRFPTCDLAVVIPVYNEQDCIAPVLEEWDAVLQRLDIDFLIIVLNDGSRDATQTSLRRFESHPRLKIVDKANSGHGPTILMGYHQAVKTATWVFQCDSDDEIKAEDFAPFWEKRDDYDAIFGVRRQRISQSSRKIVSACSRWTVALLFGKGVEDVNVPFRLMRADKLKKIIRRIPPSTFAPNVVIAGAFARSSARSGARSSSASRICNLPVTHHERQTGEVSIQKWKLLRVALRSFVQTIRLRHIARNLW